MSVTAQDALIHLMIIAASADMHVTETEIGRIDGLVSRLPVFEGYDRSRLTSVANGAVDLVNANGLEGALEQLLRSIPERLHDTAYALAVEVTAVDLLLEQEELRFLELLRDHLDLDRLVTAAIERAARARLRRVQ
ncbi:hypothetical protein EMQ25_00600 [Arsenicitalea aurantiaca]|uniref:Tellurite resistance protein TerB n=1 Tax=Arsenicitalea aurantiaca TaxID=1783274 RepID=A0A433XK91_9HYPH|nr:tellurite resistance TerB family protein [Arsenicitalea aurantiaca]RUT34497.1 hypothetical protein EMQ25_00600 [Arsenicitalea aurantiaca]